MRITAKRSCARSRMSRRHLLTAARQGAGERMKRCGSRPVGETHRRSSGDEAAGSRGGLRSGTGHHGCSTQWGPRKLILSADPTSNSLGSLGPGAPAAHRVDALCEDRGMRVLPVGEAALLLECGGTDQVRAAYAEAQASPGCRRARLRRHRAGGARRCCSTAWPIAQSVLAGIEDWPDDLPEDLEDRQVELPVTYDGPDLESVAEHTGLSVEEVVERHRATRVRGRLLRVRAGLRLPQRAAGGAARAAAGRAAVQGAAGFGRAGRSVHRASTRGPRRAAGS